MCSVIGLLSKSGKDVSPQAREMLSMLRHRGPEAFGLKSAEAEAKSKDFAKLQEFPAAGCILGHCLLSTTGYALQPITSGGVCVAHNGQVYNYPELGGSGFASDSAAIADFLGRELKNKSPAPALRSFSKKAIGEYALGIMCNGRLFAFRDFLGQKPVWFGENTQVCAFASEPGALMKIGIQFPKPLVPGHLLELGKKGFKDTKVFDMGDFRKSLRSKSRASHGSAFRALGREFAKTIGMQTRGLQKAAVLFSGGVDSSLIAKAVSQKVTDTKLFVAGLEGSHDIIAAQKAAAELGLPLEKVVLSESDVQRLAIRAMGILKFFDPMQIGIAVPELACGERISLQGFKVVFSGQGSDEIFCGYTNYAKVLGRSGYNGVEEEIWSSLSSMWSRNFYRDDLIMSSQSLELRLPFMQRGFLREAMAIPAEEKIHSADDVLRKHPVRQLAELYGVPQQISSRPKKAMQYGSGVQKIVSRLIG